MGMGYWDWFAYYVCYRFIELTNTPPPATTPH
ncbi:hypothetical protein PsAD26_00325 [Pseudovibrio sp. Ad26]|nr:hypothetical protein PsAD26_00325 [Pseudovibrio sp. Ad26]